jgi:hypothetical protein
MLLASVSTLRSALVAVVEPTLSTLSKLSDPNWIERGVTATLFKSADNAKSEVGELLEKVLLKSVVDIVLPVANSVVRYLPELGL